MIFAAKLPKRGYYNLCAIALFVLLAFYITTAIAQNTDAVHVSITTQKTIAKR